MALGDHHFQIGSEDGLRNYEVLNGHCQCFDYVRHGAGHPCKHRLALSLYQRLGFWAALDEVFPTTRSILPDFDIESWELDDR